MFREGKLYQAGLIFALIIVVLSFVPIFMSEKVLDAFVREDRIFETLSPICLFLTSVMFAIAFVRNKVPFDIKNPAWIRRMIYLGFALLFFGAAGEEISWGQRILGFSVPDLIKSHNVQKEFTLHNLDVIQGEHAIIPLDFDQLAALFVLTLGAVIPIAVYFSGRLGRRVEGIFPVLPVQLSIVFLAIYAIQKAIVRLLPLFPQFYHHPTMNIPVGVHETREFAYEFAILVSTVYYVFVKLRAHNEVRTSQASAPAGAGSSNGLPAPSLATSGDALPGHTKD